MTTVLFLKLRILNRLLWCCPFQTRYVHHKSWSLVLGALQVLVDEFWRDADDVLSFPVLDHVECLQGADYVILSYTGHHTEKQKEKEIG